VELLIISRCLFAQLLSALGITGDLEHFSLGLCLSYAALKLTLAADLCVKLLIVLTVLLLGLCGAREKPIGNAARTVPAVYPE